MTTFKEIDGVLYVRFTQQSAFNINDRVKAIVNCEPVYGTIKKVSLIGDRLLYKIAADDGKDYYATEIMITRI
jgi:hypothetical protein